MTYGDNKITTRKQNIANALAHNQNVQQINQSNAAITAENTKAASRNALLAHVQQTTQAGNQQATTYEQSLVPRVPKKRAKKVVKQVPEKGSKQKGKTKGSTKKKKELILG